MESALAIAAYRCEVAGEPTDSVDIQVRHFTSGSRSEAEEFLRSAPIHQYLNDKGQTVSWPFVAMLAFELFQPTRNGREVVGFIAGCHEFPKWAFDTKTASAARRFIAASHPGHGDFTINIEIGVPYPVSGDEWACPVSLDGLYGNLSDQRGVDSFQAMMLAVNLARTLLSGFIMDGGRLFSTEDKAGIDVDKLFATGTC